MSEKIMIDKWAVKSRIEKVNMGFKDLASKIDISPGTLENWFTNGVKQYQADAIAKAIGASLVQIVKDDEH